MQCQRPSHFTSATTWQASCTQTGVIAVDQCQIDDHAGDVPASPLAQAEQGQGILHQGAVWVHGLADRVVAHGLTQEVHHGKPFFAR